MRKRAVLAAAVAAGPRLSSGIAANGVPRRDAASQGSINAVPCMTRGATPAQRGTGNIRACVAANPLAPRVVMGHGANVQFMRDGTTRRSGTTHRNGISFDASLHEPHVRGFGFLLRDNTPCSLRLDRDRVVDKVGWVSVGVAEASPRRAREGFFYLRR
jgi:intracellular sulfur oxidation DsrE/DsrF family protein